MPQLRYFALTLLLLPTLLYGGPDPELQAYLQQRALPLEGEADLEPLLAEAGGRKLVLLGESTHGTSEFYDWRATITRRLVTDHGFSFIAVEGDFPAIRELDSYIRARPGAASSAREIMSDFRRFPHWMWGNDEFLALVEWLRDHNDSLPANRKVGLYGMDVYNEWRVKSELLEFLASHAPDTHEQARNSYRCFAPYSQDSWQYANTVAAGGEDCANATREVIQSVEEARDTLASAGEEDYFFALQSAAIKYNAERFYRKSRTRQDASAWNARAGHMHDTVTRLLALYGQEAKGVVWAHNTHIGDAHYTSMRNIEQHNIGQLSRRQWGGGPGLSARIQHLPGHC